MLMTKSSDTQTIGIIFKTNLPMKLFIIYEDLKAQFKN